MGTAILMSVPTTDLIIRNVLVNFTGLKRHFHINLIRGFFLGKMIIFLICLLIICILTHVNYVFLSFGFSANEPFSLPNIRII